MALTNAQRVVMLSGSRPAWATGMDMAWDWTTNRAWTANPITDMHSADISGQYQVGSFAPFAANTLVQTDLGLQTVPTRTNLALRSQTFENLSWVKSGTIAADNVAAAPDGTTTAATITPSAVLMTHRIHQDYTSTAAGYAISIFVKPNGYSKVAIREDAVFGAYVAFDLSGNGSVMGSGGGGTPAGTISAHANGWFRIVMTYTGSAATNRPTLYVMDAGYTSGAPNAYSYTGNGTSGVFVWQGQYELGTFASPPIVTTSSTATVNGNQQVVDLTGNVGGIIQYTPIGIVSFGNSIAFTDGAAVQAAIEYGSTSGPRILAKGANSGETAVRANSRITVAFAFSEGYQAIQQIGGSKVTQTATSLSITKMAIGGSGIAATANLYQTTQRLAIKRGVQNDATFNDLVAKATILAAVS